MAYTPTLALAQFLQSDRGQHWLTQAATLTLSPQTLLADLHQLRENLSPDETSAVVEQVLLRREAPEKFPRAAELLFTRTALEQATRYPLAQHRARRFAQHHHIADLGCSLGGDALALASAEENRHVWAFDVDAVRLTFAHHNARVYNLNRKIELVQADVGHLPTPRKQWPFTAAFADPGRRHQSGRRVRHQADYQPPLHQLYQVFSGLPLAVKVAPGLTIEQLPPPIASAIGEVEFVSWQGQLKEAVLWPPTLSQTAITRRATLLPHNLSLTNSPALSPTDCPPAPLQTYLYEPDPAVIRAGLVAHLGLKLGLNRLDEHIAYLSGPTVLHSPWVTGYHIEATLPLNFKKINRHLQTERIGRLNIKQRGTGLKPEQVQKKLTLKTTYSNERTLILLRQGEAHLALIGKRL